MIVPLSGHGYAYLKQGAIRPWRDATMRASRVSEVPVFDRGYPAVRFFHVSAFHGGFSFGSDIKRCITKHALTLRL